MMRFKIQPKTQPKIQPKILSFFALIGVTACGAPGLDDDAGRETGPCIESQCFDGLTCRDGLCVADPDADDDSPTGDGPGATSAADDAGDAGTTGESTADGSTTAGAGSDAAVDEDSVGETAPDDGEADDGEVDDGEVDDGEVDDGEVDDGSSFIGTGGEFECSIWEQDCPAGEKCNAFAEIGSSWDSMGCFDIVPAPDAIGESCDVEGNGATGLDSCVEGAICWDADPETNVGECVGYCSGSENNPQCPAGTGCAISNGGVIALCLPTCDPLAQDCAAGQGCYLLDGAFVCAPDVSDGAAYGDACEFINTCSAGHACLNSDFVGACAGAVGCCSPFCDTDAPNTCPGPQQTCVAVYAEGEAPPGFDDVGFCGVDP